MPMERVTVQLFISALLLGLTQASGATLLSQNFDDIGTLGAEGWVLANNSVPPGVTGWFQGNAGIFPSQSGAPDSYIAANFENADFGGNISNWLITPALTLTNGDLVTFYTRSAAVLEDRLEVRLNAAGTTDAGATDISVGDFTSLLLSINPLLDGSYPDTWTQFTAVVGGLAGPTNARLAFRYTVSDTSANGDYLGIDTVSVTDGAVIPEPSSALLLATGIVAAVVVRRRHAS